MQGGLWCCGRCCHMGPWGLGQRVSSTEVRAEAGSRLECAERCTAGLLLMPSVTRAEQGACQAAGVWGGPCTPRRAGRSSTPWPGSWRLAARFVLRAVHCDASLRSVPRGVAAVLLLQGSTRDMHFLLTLRDGESPCQVPLCLDPWVG